MRAPFGARVPGDALGRRPGSYDDLRRLAAQYARDHLAGLTLVNHATQLCITLTPEALGAATRDGTPTALLQAIPALPSLLSEAGYVRSAPDRRDAHTRGANLLDTRRMHLLAATAEVAGRPVKLRFTVRENFGGQCFLDRVTAPDAPDRRRGTGGGAPDDGGGDFLSGTEETGSAATSSDPDSQPDASSPQQYAVAQNCIAGHRACVASGRKTAVDCLKSLNLCRQGIPTIFAPGIWGVGV